LLIFENKKSGFVTSGGIVDCREFREKQCGAATEDVQQREASVVSRFAKYRRSSVALGQAVWLTHCQSAALLVAAVAPGAAAVP
jgi:hypothetical protein